MRLVFCKRLLTIALCLTAPASSLTLTAQLQDASARVLLATVVDARARNMVDFAADDFVVSEGGHEREILDVHVADYPLAILLDDQAPAAVWPVIQQAAVRFINRIGERPLVVATTSNNGQIIATLDDDRAAVVGHVQRFAPTPGATQSALPAVAGASAKLAATESPFSAVVIIASRPIDAADPVRGDLLPLIVGSGANVHVVETMSSAGRPDDLLKVIADQTRGQYIPIFTPASFSIALDRLADRLSSELMIQYLVAPGERTADVRVGVKRPGAMVLGLGVSK